MLDLNCFGDAIIVSECFLETDSWEFFLPFKNINLDIFSIDNYYLYGYEQYNLILAYACSMLSFVLLLGAVAYLFSTKEVDFEKVSVYECGFEPYGEARDIFNVQFFVVGILFLLFELEVVFLIPWVLFLGNLSWYSFVIMFLFLFFLVIGFIYEWHKGALDWI